MNDSKKKPARKELSIKALEALEFAVDNKVWILTATLSDSTPPHFDRRNKAMTAEMAPIDLEDGKDPVPRTAFRDDVPEMNHQVFESLRIREFLLPLDKDKLCEKHNLAKNVDGRGYFAWYDRPWGVSKAGVDHLNANRERLAQARKERSEAPEELIVVKAGEWCVNGGMRAVHGVGPLCRVLRRTEKRVYVERIDEKGGWSNLIQGSGRNTYIDAEHVLAEGVTPEIYERMTQAELDYQASMRHAEEQMRAEMEPIKKRFEDRAKQIAARLEDELREFGTKPDAAPKL